MHLKNFWLSPEVALCSSVVDIRLFSTQHRDWGGSQNSCSRDSKDHMSLSVADLFPPIHAGPVDRQDRGHCSCMHVPLVVNGALVMHGNPRHTCQPHFVYGTALSCLTPALVCV